VSRLVVALAIGSLVAAGVVTVTACVDTTPFYVPPEDASPPPPPPVDAGPDAPDVDTRSSCQRCIETPDMPGPGCGDELAICLADPKCKGTYDCMLARGCLTKADQRKIILCGLPCAAEAGIVSQNEPAADEIYTVATCAESACPGPCGIGDAGTD